MGRGHRRDIRIRTRAVLTALGVAASSAPLVHARGLTWDNGAGDAQWTNPTNWTGTNPGDPDNTAPYYGDDVMTFPAGFPRGASTINLQTNQTAGGLIFHDSYTLGSGGTYLSFYYAGVMVDQGKTATINNRLNSGFGLYGPGKLVLGGNNTGLVGTIGIYWGGTLAVSSSSSVGGASIEFENGTLQATASLFSSREFHLVPDSANVLDVSAPLFSFSGVLKTWGSGDGSGNSTGTLHKTGTGTMLLIGRYGLQNNCDLEIDAGKVQLEVSPGGYSSCRFWATPMATGTTFDLTDNKIVYTHMPAGSWNGSAYDGVSGLVQSGRNGGAWNGSTGFVTSQTQATHGNYTSIAVAAAGDVRPDSNNATAIVNWAGQRLAASDTLIMYTYGGDATLDGMLNIDDYIRIDTGIAAGLTGWSNGDFNYDGKVNIDDYTTIIDANIGIQSGVFPTAGGSSSVVAVPEPVFGCAMLLMFTSLHRRRRR